MLTVLLSSEAKYVYHWNLTYYLYISAMLSSLATVHVGMYCKDTLETIILCG